MSADELVEKVARELCKASGSNPDAHHSIADDSDDIIHNWRAFVPEARAAIAIVVEACAKVAEGAHDRSGRQWVSGSLWDTLSRETAARIRSLSPSSGSTGGNER